MALERIEGLDINVQSWGSGSPSLVFVHGFACDVEDWQPQVARLAGRFRCIALDLPGHGRSGLPTNGDVQHLARVVCAVKGLHAGARTVLVGHSLGCRVILNAMSLCPAGVAGLVLIEQNLVSGHDVEAAIDALEARLEQVGVHNFLRGRFDAMFSSESDPAFRTKALSRVDRLDAHFAQELLASSMRWEAQTVSQLATLKLPVLLLQGTYLDERFEWHRLESGMTTPWIATVLEHVPQARFQLIEDTGHFAQVEAAEQVTKCIDSFAGGLA